MAKAKKTTAKKTVAKKTAAKKTSSAKKFAAILTMTPVYQNKRGKKQDAANDIKDPALKPGYRIAGKGKNATDKQIKALKGIGKGLKGAGIYKETRSNRSDK